MAARLVAPAIAFASASLAAIIQVQVGAGGLKYDPATVTASQGDIVEFIWNGEEHSVSQAVESDPCHPASDAPFNSGAISTGSWYITINNTDPIYYYCGVRKHCQLGMVGGINLPSASNFSSYQSSSSEASENVLPSVVEGGTFGTPMAAAASSSTSSPSSASVASSTSSSSMTSATAASSAMSSSAAISSSSVTAASSSASSSSAAMSSSASAASMSSTASSTGGAAAMATHVAGLVAGLPLALAVLL